MDDDFLLELGGLFGILVLIALGFFLLRAEKKRVLARRIARVTNRKQTASVKKTSGTLSLRRNIQGNPLPFIGETLRNIAGMSRLRERLERCGIKMPADVYIIICASLSIGVAAGLYLLGKPPALCLPAGIFAGVILPHIVVGFKGGRRTKKFLKLFPEAIDFIVRGLRSGLPVTESLNIIGLEMEDPVKEVFFSIGESVRLGVPFEKALYDMGQKLQLAEFNFFVTSIILQRETGGNLSEILNNLSDVLRKRFMMRMKIKAMSSEAKASAIIIGSLPFVVIAALRMLSPSYMDPLINDPRGHIAVAIAATSLFSGIFIMIKMSRFEI